MGTAFEKLTRPFATPVFIAKQPVYPVPVSNGSVDGTLTWGDPGPVPAPVTDDVSFTIKAPEKYTEVSRSTVTRRITNPDDTSQHVDVKDPTSIKMQKINNVFVPQGGTAGGPTQLDGSQYDVGSGKNSQGQTLPGTITVFKFATPNDGTIISQQTNDAAPAIDPGPPGTTFP